MSTSMDTHFLNQALQQAQRRKGFTAPNPAVGAVLVKEGQIIATGTHWLAGDAHAEIAALAQLPSGAAAGATLYVTLEPCCHTGKTPPCVNAIINAGVKRVVFSETDPNPLVAGKGAALLGANDIVCQQLSVTEIEQFYGSYRYLLQSGMPWLCGKLAMTLDGKIAEKNGRALAITGKQAHVFTHQQRLKHEAILTSVKTILQDAPQFNVRLAEADAIAKPLIVLDTHAELPLDASVWYTTSQLYIVHGEAAEPERLAQLKAKGAKLLAVALNNANRLDLTLSLTALGKFGFHDLWLEAGGTLFKSFAKLGLLNEAYCYLAPWWAGLDAQAAFTSAHFFKDVVRRQWLPLGDDVALHLEF